MMLNKLQIIIFLPDLGTILAVQILVTLVGKQIFVPDNLTIP